jgi:hypothetical protein
MLESVASRTVYRVVILSIFLSLFYITLVYCTVTNVFLTKTEEFPCFFLSCKANARVKLAKTGHRPHSTTLVCILCCSDVIICVVRLLFVLFYVLFVCK